MGMVNEEKESILRLVGHIPLRLYFPPLNDKNNFDERLSNGTKWQTRRFFSVKMHNLFKKRFIEKRQIILGGQSWRTGRLLGNLLLVKYDRICNMTVEDIRAEGDKTSKNPLEFYINNFKLPKCDACMKRGEDLCELWLRHELTRWITVIHFKVTSKIQSAPIKS
jgi:hypothetical protein